MLTGSNEVLSDSPGKGPGIDFANIGLVLFDLDGTLVDSVRDLAWCGNQTLTELGLPQRDPEAARLWVGNGVERFVKRVLTGEMEAEPETALFESALEIFNRLYAEHYSDRSVLYPGVLEGLQAFAGYGRHLACVTNKPEPFTSQLIAAQGIDGFFELVVAGNTTARKKPDPMPLHFAADHFGLDYGSCMMVGDSSNDVKAARNAGFVVACVPYGYNHGNDIRESSPDLVVDNIQELAGLFA